MRAPLIACLALDLSLAAALPDAQADDLARTIERVKPSVVGIGSFNKTRSPPIGFIGTGFVVGDGLTVISAAHVVRDLQAADGAATLGVLVSLGEQAQFRAAQLLAMDGEHDLVALRIHGAPLPPLQLGDSGMVVEGKALAFTGFPLGMVLGLHHVTHRAMVSAITPVAMAAPNAAKLDARKAAQLGKPAYAVFQLDGTAYPGNSGSPLFDPDTAQVVGVINMVYVRGVKESAISHPSGITYAIPANYIRAMPPGVAAQPTGGAASAEGPAR